LIALCFAFSVWTHNDFSQILKATQREVNSELKENKTSLKKSSWEKEEEKS